MIFGKTTFAGGALGFNLGEISSLISDKGLLENGLVRLVDNKWKEYFNKSDADVNTMAAATICNNFRGDVRFTVTLQLVKIALRPCPPVSALLAIMLRLFDCYL